MRRKILLLFKTIWRSISFLIFATSLLYLWPNIRDLPSQYGADWSSLLPDREFITLFLLFISIIWIFSIEIRPFFSSMSGVNVFERLRVGQFNVERGLKSDESKDVGLKLMFKLHNDSLDTAIYAQMQKAYLIIDGRANQAAKIEMPPTRVEPLEARTISLAAVFGLEEKQLYEGKVELSFVYGKTREKMKFYLKYEGIILVQIDNIDEKWWRDNTSISHRVINHSKKNQ